MARKLRIVPTDDGEREQETIEASPVPVAARVRYRALDEIHYISRDGNPCVIGPGARFSTDGWIVFDPKTMERIDG